MLFRSQFKMTAQEKSGMQRFVRYAILFYVEYWFAAPIAPRSDLEYLKRLEKYDDRQIQTASTKALNRHLWYISEELVSFAFFDGEVDCETKRNMVYALKKPGLDLQPKRIDLKHDKQMSETTLADFVASRSRPFLKNYRFR